MRGIVVLAVILLALIVSTVRVATRHPKHVVLADADDPDPAVLSPEPPVVPVPARSALPPLPARRARVGVARLVGRVLLPPGASDAEVLSGLSVVADDGVRAFEGFVSAGGRFSFHLPAGFYALTASAGTLVGTALGVTARPDTERAIDIRLGAGATISGSFRAPEGAAIDLTARYAGGTTPAGVAETGDGTFSVAGLAPGRRYDLTFHGEDVRTATLSGIVAPAGDQEVVLEPVAVVRGAVGFPRGGLCPIDRVKLQLPGAPRKPPVAADEIDAEAGATTSSPERDCRFELSVPDGAAEVTVVATGPGWYLEERVEIPAHGDPEAVCLNPPCRADPSEGSARLRVAIAGADPALAIAATATVDDDGVMSRFGCRSSGGWCVMDALPVGRAIEVRGEVRAGVRAPARGAGCRAEPQTLTLGAGENFVSLGCAHPL